MKIPDQPEIKAPQWPGPGDEVLQLLNALLLDESGQDLAEYAVLIGLIALAVMVAVLLLGGTISAVYNSIGSSLADGTFPVAGDPPTCCD